MSYCARCLEDFRYDDTGGYNPPARCQEHCRNCCEGDCYDDGSDDEPRQRLCDGTCDTCNCEFWDQYEVPTLGEQRANDGGQNG